MDILEIVHLIQILLTQRNILKNDGIFHVENGPFIDWEDCTFINDQQYNRDQQTMQQYSMLAVTWN